MVESVNSRTDVMLAIAVVAILMFMIVPLPSFMLDILLAINITFSLMILLVPIYAVHPLEFSVFPGVLLLVTLFRLSLNVASTRLILGEAYAGDVIEAFGQFVVGGNYVVGLVIFVILVIINFVVITKGSGRIAEVAARFTLDAMPGKQMAIDADLNAGLIDEPEARKRRDIIRKEADFYGAMDGASKFVRGDAIAGVLITAINIIGGLIIGVLQLNMNMTDALANYTILTVGDGLVSQIPALLISTSAGIIVTRAASEDNLARTLTTQLLTKSRVAYVSGGVLLFMGMVPGLPGVPFFLLGAATIGVGYVAANATAEAQQATLEEEPEKEEPQKDKIENYLHVDPLEIEIGYSLIPMIDVNQDGDLLETLTMIRKQLAQELGIIVPPIRIRDNVQLNSNEYVIRIKGNEIARGEVMHGYYLALLPDGEDDELEGIKTVDPTFNMTAYWMNREQRDRAELKGYTIVEASAVVSTHLMEVLKSNAFKIVDRQAVQKLLDNFKEENPAVVEELVPNLLSVGTIQNVMRNLLQENIPVRDLSTILETLADRAALTKDPELLTEYVRMALAETISHLYKDANGEIYAMTLDPRFEEHVLNQMSGGKKPSANFNLPPPNVNEIFTNVTEKMQQLISTSSKAIMITGPMIRRYIRAFFEPVHPGLVVLSYSELLPDIVINSVGTIGTESYD
ncbi:flagellar biosynthesis protein FlhA [bacterium]|nr:flagellar biosynthesis protein FlhA [bacterium]